MVFSQKNLYICQVTSHNYVSQSTVLILKREFSLRNVPEENAEIQGLRILCYKLGQKELRILHFSYIQNAYPADLVLLWPIRSPHPTLVKVV